MSFNKYRMDQETQERLVTFMQGRLPADGNVDAFSLSSALMREFTVIGKGAIQFHLEPRGEWTAAYVYGKLAESPGDNYHADELLQQIVGVENVQDSDFLLEDGRTAPDTLEELRQMQIAKAEAAHAKALAEAEAVRAKAIADAEAAYQAQVGSI